RCLSPSTLLESCWVKEATGVSVQESVRQTVNR
ncbi:uncharacterized, partial [Tachysurus ichikawai]